MHDKDQLKLKQKLIEQYKEIRKAQKEIFEYKISKLTRLKDEFTNKINKLCETPNPFISLEQDLISSEIINTDNNAMNSIGKLASLFSRKLQLAQSNFVRGTDDYEILKKSLQITKSVLTFSAYLAFETHNRIQVKQISKSPSQFSRCKKAVAANIKAGCLDGSGYDTIDVLDAFKIENYTMLELFEKKKKAQKGKYVLKGLFSHISESDIFNIILYGNENKKEISEISQIPKNLKSKIYGEPAKKMQEILKINECENTGFKTPLYMSNYSAGEEIKIKLSNKEDSKNILIMALCRVIIPQETSEGSSEIFYSKLKESYEIHNLDLIYPEYIMLCKFDNKAISPEKSPSKSPKILAGGSSTPKPSTTADDLKTIENDEISLKNELKKQYDQFWLTINQKVQHNIHPQVIEESGFIVSELKSQIENLKQKIETLSQGSTNLKLMLD